MTRKRFLAAGAVVVLLLALLSGIGTPGKSGGCNTPSASTNDQSYSETSTIPTITAISAMFDPCFERVEFTVAGTQVPDIQAGYTPDAEGATTPVLQVFVHLTGDWKFLSYPITYDQQPGVSLMRDLRGVGTTKGGVVFQVALNGKYPFWIEHEVDQQNRLTTVSVGFVSDRS